MINGRAPHPSLVKTEFSDDWPESIRNAAFVGADEFGARWTIGTRDHTGERR